MEGTRAKQRESAVRKGVSIGISSQRSQESVLISIYYRPGKCLEPRISANGQALHRHPTAPDPPWYPYLSLLGGDHKL